MVITNNAMKLTSLRENREFNTLLRPRGCSAIRGVADLDKIAGLAGRVLDSRYCILYVSVRLLAWSVHQSRMPADSSKRVCKACT